MNIRQFFILMFGSLVFVALIIKEILLSRALTRQQMVLVDIRNVISAGPRFENGWKQIAFPISQASRQDSDLAALLKSEHIEVRTNQPANAGSPPAAPPSSKDPTAPQPPAAP